MRDVQLLHWIWGMWREKWKTRFLRYSIELPSCFQQNVSDSGPSPPTLQETLRRANNMLWESSSSGLCRWLVPVIRVPGKLRGSLKKRIMKSMNHNINLIHKFWSLADLHFNVVTIYPSQNRSKWKQNVCVLSALGRNVDEYGRLLLSFMFHKIPEDIRLNICSKVPKETWEVEAVLKEIEKNWKTESPVIILQF